MAEQGYDRSGGQEKNEQSDTTSASKEQLKDWKDRLFLGTQIFAALSIEFMAGIKLPENTTQAAALGVAGATAGIAAYLKGRVNR